MKKITEDWLKSADADLSIIERILDQENLSHQVAFHAQQAVEKAFKAVIEEFETGFVKTHSLAAVREHHPQWLFIRRYLRGPEQSEGDERHRRYLCNLHQPLCGRGRQFVWLPAGCPGNFC
jgi:hypothetical protein